MTNNSHQFRTQSELENREGAYPIGNNKFRNRDGEWLPLYEGKMVQSFDHRAASVIINPENQHRPAQPLPATSEQHQDTSWLPNPQFWVSASSIPNPNIGFQVGFKDVTSPTNARTMIASAIPAAGVGNTLPILLGEEDGGQLRALHAAYILGNLNAIILDFVARQKVQGQHLNWFIVEQLPVVPFSEYQTRRFGAKTAGDIVREAVLALSYTSDDMSSFARELGGIDQDGRTLPPFVWDDERRLTLRAKLDALYFHLYGITDRDDIRHVYSTFPIVERQEQDIYDGRYRSCDLCLAYVNALAAGDPDAVVRP